MFKWLQEGRRGIGSVCNEACCWSSKKEIMRSLKALMISIDLNRLSKIALITRQSKWLTYWKRVWKETCVITGCRRQNYSILFSNGRNIFWFEFLWCQFASQVILRKEHLFPVNKDMTVRNFLAHNVSSSLQWPESVSFGRVIGFTKEKATFLWTSKARTEKSIKRALLLCRTGPIQ